MEDWINSNGRLKVEAVDVGRAHFHARAWEHTYIELPEERKSDSEWPFGFEKMPARTLMSPLQPWWSNLDLATDDLAEAWHVKHRHM